MTLSFARYAGLVCGLFLAVLFAALSWFLLDGLEQQRRSEARNIAQGFALRMMERFGESLGAVYLLGGTLDRKSGTVRQFDETAIELLRDFPLVRALQLAPGGVITYVSPLSGNEVIVGHDLLVDKTRNREVHLAISRRQMAVAGPFELRQGGLAIIARYPLFIPAADGRPQFWGLAIGVVDYPALLRAAGDSDFERIGLAYQLCWVSLGEQACKTPEGVDENVAANAERLRIGSSYADWRLAVHREAGWLTAWEVALAMFLVVLGALLGGWLAGRLIAERWCLPEEDEGLATTVN
ncbi:MAG: hypothetical protein CVU34_10855 [Betaproteobacteria bacterium HGW-Betaproteobacteria-7]|jgi:sensor domain CHASE-containing protein|nr:MAG: hypothetical protein CVU34_10855 [Betaproteobacteria bacterium HGW-Betaproteobacteria-7]